MGAVKRLVAEKKTIGSGVKQLLIAVAGTFSDGKMCIRDRMGSLCGTASVFHSDRGDPGLRGSQQAHDPGASGHSSSFRLSLIHI